MVIMPTMPKKKAVKPATVPKSLPAQASPVAKARAFGQQGAAMKTLHAKVATKPARQRDDEHRILPIKKVKKTKKL